MGCEICRNENRENIEYKLTRGSKGNIPIEFKTKKTEDNYYLTKESFLEEKLNKKYSISPNTLEELKEKITNENLINTKKDELSNNTNKEYIINTLNIYSNNTIHFGTINKKKKEKNSLIENETIDLKNKENMIYESSNFKKENIKNEEESTKKLKSNLKNKNDINTKKTNKKGNKVSIFLTDLQIEKKESCEKHRISQNNDKDKDKDEHDNLNHGKSNKKQEKSEKKIKLKRCYKLSDKDKGDENSQNNIKPIKNDNSNKEEEKDKKYSEDIVFEENEDDTDSDSDSGDNDSESKDNKKKKKGKKRKGHFIKYSYTKQISKKTEKINLLLKDIDHSKIDKILKKAPKRKKKKIKLEKLITNLRKHIKKLSLIERAWLIYKWITENIEYDLEGLNAYSYDISEEATIKRGKSNSSGYAKLYKKLSDNLELTTERIEGFSKGYNFNFDETIENIEESEKHDWNAVQIENEWFLIDTTWGSGYIKDEKFIKQYNPYYFFTPPQEFVRGHLPFESKWQLLPKSKRVCHQNFMAFAPLKKDFYIFGFNAIEPDFTFFNAKEKGKITLYFEKNKEINRDNINIKAQLFLIEDENNNDNNNNNNNNKEDKEITNSILEIRNDDYYEINYIINKKGEYKLKILGNDGRFKEYNELCTLRLTSEKDEIRSKKYPLTTDYYHNSDIKVINPISGILKEGNKINFEIKATTYDKLYICTNTDEEKNYIQMYQEKNIFKEEDFLIYGKKVIIACKGENTDNYNPILEYDVLPITKKRSTITHPHVFIGPKTKLIEPICDKLKKGKKVNFTVKGESVEEMAVMDGDDIFKLDKKNNIFSGSVKISGKGDVKIVYKKQNDEYEVLYLYKIY